MGAETSLAMQGFGVGAQATGAYFQAQGQKSTLNAQAHIDDVNAALADMSAQSALLSGQREEQASNLDIAQLKSTQKASMAANGIDLGSTTAVNVLTSTDVIGQWKASTIAANAMRRAFGYQTTGLGYTNDALDKRATAGAINPFFNVAGSLVSGAGKVADSWYKFKKEGAFDPKTGSSKYGPQNDLFARNFGQHNLVSDALY